MSFAVSPSATVPAAPSSSSAAAADPAGGGGFAALFDQVSAAAGHAESRPSPSPASKNQADQPPDDAPDAAPDQANQRPEPRSATAPQPGDSTPTHDKRAAEPEHAATTQPAGAVAEGKPLPAGPETAPALAPEALGVAPADGMGITPASLPVAPQVAVESQAPTLHWHMLAGGMRVLTTAKTIDTESLANFAHRQGLSADQWQWLNAHAAQGRPGMAALSPSAQATATEASPLLGAMGAGPNAAGAALQAGTAAPSGGPQAAGVVPLPQVQGPPTVEVMALEIDPALMTELGLGDEWRPEASMPRTPQTPTPMPLPTAVASPAATFAAQWYKQGEAYQALARQLGEAMASRLQQQVGKGQWQMQLTLRPASLGRVDVDLSMRKGELEATFQASQAATRELLVDSFPRLREALQQSGTQVASLDVQGESRGDGDRKPTPQPMAGEKASSDQASQGANVTNRGPTTLADDAVDVWA
ncbi:MAG: flagellar hook-length control protein FliK [Burkholderiaceae bacterium]